MSLPVIADVYQAVLVWTNALAPRPATNVLHFSDIPGTQTEANLFADIETNVTNTMWSHTTTGSRVATVQITKLDGISAGQSFAAVVAAKWAGSNGGHIIPQGAQVISLKSTVRGPRGRNRVYLPWCAEAVYGDGVFDAANVTAMTSAWNTFSTNMVAAGWQLSVVSGLYASQDPVASIVVRTAMRTQRRRQR